MSFNHVLNCRTT